MNSLILSMFGRTKNKGKILYAQCDPTYVAAHNKFYIYLYKPKKSFLAAKW